MRIKSLLISLLLSAAALPLFAQRKVSADVQVKTVVNGKVTLNQGETYYMVTNPKGEMQVYEPGSGQVYAETDPSLSSSADLVWLFMSGRIDDLGLGAYGYKATASTREEGLVKKTFTPSDVTRPVVEIVYENYLPIYCAYTAQDGKLLSKKYLSNYQRFGRFTLPLRVTDIAYGTGRDSSVVRTLYSSVKVDVDDPSFAFEVPADAKPMQLQAESK